MTLPVIPAGRPPVPPTVQSELAALRMRIDELTRRGPVPGTPVCRVKLNVDVAMGGGDIFAQNNWVIGEDPDGIATLSTASGTNSFITFPRTGRYLVMSRSAFTSPASSGSCATYLMRNAANINSSIARDARNTTNAGGDGTTCHAIRSFLFNAGDVLYWGHWTSVAVTLSHLTLNVPTEVSITWQGTR